MPEPDTPTPPAPLVTVRALTVDDLFDAVALACEISPDPEAMIEAFMPKPGPKPPASEHTVREAARMLEEGESDAAVQDFIGEVCTTEQMREHLEARREHRKQYGARIAAELLKILPRLAGELREKVYGWLAGLCGMEAAEWRALPLTALPQTLRQLVARPEFPDFFEEFRALQAGGSAPAPPSPRPSRPS